MVALICVLFIFECSSTDFFFFFFKSQFIQFALLNPLHTVITYCWAEPFGPVLTPVTVLHPESIHTPLRLCSEQLQVFVPHNLVECVLVCGASSWRCR